MKFIFLILFLFLTGCASYDWVYDEDYDPVQHEIFLMKQIDPRIQAQNHNNKSDE
jgi:hypothetical protein